ncbi:V-type proton ATPase subunit C 1-A [Liparis tanakae]|uniref:V-type proton ATPase subunit C n=1 Tax=Liparis tanakae TaxID=230148 RepID=A0A4Z2GF67_9TELE|nr:V-type proton ATPase subunit C 1-A [Liparis tanakae]
MLSRGALILSRYFVRPSGSCTRTEREAFSPSHCSKELCVNSKPKPGRATYDPYRFTVREYSFELEAQKEQEMRRRSVHKKEQHGIFVHWLKVNFSRVFVAWIHLKALRVFVESILRYGIPVSYQALVLCTDQKRSKRLKQELTSLFVHLDPTASASKTHQASCDLPEICQHEYLSYICYHINTNLLEIS